MKLMKLNLCILLMLKDTFSLEAAHYRVVITKTCLYNFDPLKPHFYIVKLGFTGVYIIFLISAQNIDCRYSLEPPRRSGSNEYHSLYFEQKGEVILTSTHNLCFEQKCEKYRSFII